MIDAGPAKWCVLLVGFGLSCHGVRTDPSSDEAERARREPHATSERDAARHEKLGSLASRSTEPLASVMLPSEPVGGRWVSCYANYRPTGAPERDVARLGALCGPQNGMIAVRPVAGGEATDTVADHRLEAGAGDCFRIFAVADAFVSDLGVEVVSPRGNAVTWDRNGDRWPVLNPDGPFCVFDAGTYTVRVRALQGRGRYALQIWRLP
jgi:hypothetical protein